MEMGTMLFSSERAALAGSQLIARNIQVPWKSPPEPCRGASHSPVVFLGLWSFCFLQQRKKFQEWRPGLFNRGLDSAGHGSLGNRPVLGGSFTYRDFQPLEPDPQEALLRHWQCLDS